MELSLRFKQLITQVNEKQQECLCNTSIMGPSIESKVIRSLCIIHVLYSTSFWLSFAVNMILYY